MEAVLTQEKSSSDELVQVVARLSTDQIRFVVARQEFSTDKEAAEEIGIKPDTVYQWKHKGHPIDEAVRLMALDGIIIAKELRRRNLAKAMAVKVAGLDVDDDKLRQAIATEIIEWEMGKAAQRQEVSGPGGGPVAVEHDIDRDTIAEALRILGRADGSQGGGGA